MKLIYGVCLLSSALVLSACGSDDDDNEMPTYSYQVEVKNLTNAQPLSPIGLAVGQELMMWEAGETADVALEKLAEGGDNSDWLQQAEANGAWTSLSGEGPVMPGTTATLMLDFQAESPMAKLALVTMLVNTNDAFTGLNGVMLPQVVGESLSWQAMAWDAGTEANSEAAGTIPGPADGGEGYNASRDDTNKISIHPGVISMDDGFTTSVLNQAHRFDNPVIGVRITRIE